MSTTFLRILKYGFQNFWRNGWLSVATIVVMILALLLFQGLIILNVITDKTVSVLRDKIDIAVYFKIDAPEDDILKIEKALESQPEVKRVDYISRDKALAAFKEKHAEDQVVSQALTELEFNPLLASLNIKANDSKNYPQIASYLDNPNFQPIIDHVDYRQNQTAIERLNKIIDTANQVGLILTIFIAFAAALVAFNTIRMAIYSSREEIGIMRLVGASNTFIKGPYLVSGILYGLIGTVIALLIMAPAVNFAAPRLSQLIPEINLQSYFYAHLLGSFGYLLLFGVGLGIISSWVAIRRYLKV